MWSNEEKVVNLCQLFITMAMILNSNQTQYLNDVMQQKSLFSYQMHCKNKQRNEPDFCLVKADNTRTNTKSVARCRLRSPEF